MSVLLTDDKEIGELNKVYRKKDKATDVLSFPTGQKRGMRERKKQREVLGDVVISIETTKRQAKEFKVSFKSEFQRLLIHGVLHLLGYDHEGVTRKKAEKMRRKEKELFLLSEID